MLLLVFKHSVILMDHYSELSPAGDIIPFSQHIPTIDDILPFS